MVTIDYDYLSSKILKWTNAPILYIMVNIEVHIQENIKQL